MESNDNFWAFPAAVVILAIAAVIYSPETTAQFTGTNNPGNLTSETGYANESAARGEGASTDSLVREETVIIAGPPRVNTMTAHDVTTRSARLRGVVEMNGVKNGITFFVYGEAERLIDRVPSQYDQLSAISEENASLQVEPIDSNVSQTASYVERVSGLDDDTEHFYRLCVQYEAASGADTLACGEQTAFVTDDRNRGSNSERAPSVRTDRVTTVENNAAVLAGQVDMNDFDRGQVFFAYGESEAAVDKVDVTFSEYSDIEEDGEDLRTDRVDSSLNGTETYRHRITDLDDSTEHFYQICVSYDGDTDDLVCGGTRSFTTDTFSRQNHPDVFTDAARRVGEERADLRGVVDMNDYFDGLVFIVYGTDHESVEDVPDRHNEYLDIRQNGDALQRVAIDRDLDGADTFVWTRPDLRPDTAYVYRLCVEYKIDDERSVNREVPTLRCGAVESFATTQR